MGNLDVFDIGRVRFDPHCQLGFAAVVFEAFHLGFLRIVATLEGRDELTIDFDALDITTLPLQPRQHDSEWLQRIERESSVVHELVTASDESKRAFLSDVKATDWFTVGSNPSTGMDGFSFFGCAARGSLTHRFDAWNPDRESVPHFRFLRALHRLAAANVRAWQSLAALDAFQPSSDVGAVFRDFGGSPRHVRIAGFVASLRVPELRARLDGIAATEPVVLDLFNAGGHYLMIAEALDWARGRDVVIVRPRRGFPREFGRFPKQRCVDRLGELAPHRP